MLVLLHGRETYLARIKLQELREKAAAERALIQDIDCAEENVREVFQSLNTSSLFDSKKFVVVRNAFETKEWQEKEVHVRLLQTNPHTLVFLAKEPRKTDPLFKFLLKEGAVEEFPKLQGQKLKTWLAAEIKKQGVPFAPGVDDLLILFCGEDAERLSREVAKLATYRRFATQHMVSKEDVHSLVWAAKEPRIFSTIDAISAKERARATSLLAEHVAAGEAPLQLLSMFAWHVRLLLSVKDLLAREASRQEIARKLRLHPFVAQKSFAAVERFSFKELKELYRRIFALDLAFKTGRGNPEQLLYLFVGQASTKEKAG